MLINSNLNHGSDIPIPGGSNQQKTDKEQINNGIGNVPIKDLIVKGGNQFED